MAQTQGTTKAVSTQTTALKSEAPPIFFEGRETVSYSEFIAALRDIADEHANHPEVERAHAQLLAEKGLSPEELPVTSFSRARLAFESARDSGLWGIRGTVTDQMPWSDRIWKQWSDRHFTPDGPRPNTTGKRFPTAVAECDELGALFAILARDLGVVGFVGLHWPFWNHVVPVWQVSRKEGGFVRIVVPATQTFLAREATIGTTELETRRVVFPYVRQDVKSDAPLDAQLVRYLLNQSRQYAGLSTEAFTQRRLRQRREYRPQN